MFSISGAARAGGAHWRGLFAFAFALVAVIPVSPASAASTRLPLGFSPITGSGIGVTLNEPSGIGVDETSSNVFLNDGFNKNVLYILGAEGAPPSALATPYEIKGFNFGFESNEDAVDNSPTSPNQGTLYVADNENHKVRRFARNSVSEDYEEILPALSSNPAFGPVNGVAVDAAGSVYVSDRNNSEIVEFDPTGAEIGRLKTNPGAGPEVPFASGVALDAAGDLFVQGAHEGPVVKFPAGAGGEIDQETFEVVVTKGALGIEANLQSDALFIAFNGHVVEYDAATLVPRLDFGTGTLSPPEGSAGDSVRLAYNAAKDWVYASDARADDVAVFGAPVTVAGVKAGEATKITPISATLNGTVNPDGLAVSQCIFEWGKTTAYGNTAPCEGSIPTDSADHPVSAAISGLVLDTTYHFRLSATDANGTNISEDASFKSGAQGITENASNVKGTKATLNGAVFPSGAPITECIFEWGLTTAYGNTIPCNPEAGSIPADNAEHHVIAELTHLKPNGTTYHFRIRTKGVTPSTPGADKQFTTKDTVITTQASKIGPEEATLNGTLNPEGVPYTACLFEYGTTTAYGSTVPCVETPAQIGSGESPFPVHADITGLEEGVTYHFQLIGANADGTTPSAGQHFTDQSFKTLTAPLIEAEWAQGVGLAEATVKAKINPEALPSEYWIEWGETETYGQSSGNLVLGSDRNPHTVSRLLEGLSPGTIYHYRFVAKNGLGESEGEDHSFRTFPVFVPETTCPNQAFRGGPAAQLADCRAYEMVSPVDKGGGDILANPGSDNGKENGYRQSSTEGDRITYTSATPFGDAARGAIANQYLASREAGVGWSSHGLNPPQGTTVFDPFPNFHYALSPTFLGFSEDLCAAAVTDENLVPLMADALAGHTNLYRRDNCGAGAGSYLALTRELTSPAAVDLSLWYASLSGDGNHLVFGASGALVSTPPAAESEKQQVYDYSGGELHLISVLPGGEAAGGVAALGSAYHGPVGHGRESPLERAVSEDGSRIFWTSGSNLYVRVDGVRTLLVEAGANFLTAAKDGSKAVYSKEGKLWEFDLDLALEEEVGGASSEAARIAATSEIAGEAGGVVGSSEDLSYLYFTSKEALDEGADSSGEYNLYLRQGGVVGFVANVSPADRSEATECASCTGSSIDSQFPIEHSSRVSADGRHLIFMSTNELTDYDNADAITGEAASEVYRYDADSATLACVSCNPSGARPRGRKLGGSYAIFKETKLQAAAWIPTWEWSNYGKRSLAAEGERVFFNSFDALVPQDTNGAQDVYEWEAPGSHCKESSPTFSPLNEGCISLISTGQSPEESEFIDASADGRDVFFVTASSINPRDPGSIDLYDAREGGGFPPPPPPPPPCVGDACQSVPAPPSPPSLSSASVHGPGNPTPGCGKGRRQVHRHGKAMCVRKGQKHAAKRHKHRAARPRHHGR